MMNRKERTEFLKKQIKPIITEIIRLEKKYGANNTKIAMNRYLRQSAEEGKRKKIIYKLQREIDELQKKRL